MPTLYNLALQLGSLRQMGARDWALWGMEFLSCACLGPCLHSFLLCSYVETTPPGPATLVWKATTNYGKLKGGMESLLHSVWHFTQWHTLVLIYRAAASGLPMDQPNAWPEGDTTAAILASLPTLIPQRYYARLWDESPCLLLTLFYVWHHSSVYLYPWLSSLLKPAADRQWVRLIYSALCLLAPNM